MTQASTVPLFMAVASAGLAASNGEARRLVRAGMAAVDHVRMVAVLTAEDAE